MTFKPFNEMTESDYAAVGFKSGLEIHQQLLTKKKLFCRCPAGLYSDSFNAEILRHMRPTLSELGEYDGTALMEFKTRKEIIYQINRATVCTYEMDDTPPFELNDEALDIALEVGLLYGCAMVDEIHIARKQYLDGSIPTGFQRTTIVGVDGSIPYKDRRINIVQLGLEEDACREVSDTGHLRVYLTDRLGMPLIESVTAPEMRTPQEVAEVADILRKLVRSTGKVRTGIGAARQDVNVSVTGGTRIEIKGVPRIPNIPLLTYHEAMRQYNLLRLRDELHRRGITKETFSSKTEEVTKLLRKTRYQPLKNAITEGLKVHCVLLRGFKGLLRWQTQTDTFFSREISDRVRVISCLTTLPNIVHSDSPSETLASSEWQLLKKSAGATDDDTIVLVWGSKQDVTSGAAEIVIRAREAAIGIPSETRQALRDGTNGFERILPGADRMYPDTDLPPRRITQAHLSTIRTSVPAPFWDNESWYRSLSIPADVIEPLSYSPLAPLFAAAVKEWKLPPTLVAVTLIQLPKRVAKAIGRRVTFSIDTMRELLLAHKDGLLAREGFLGVLMHAARGHEFARTSLYRISDEELTALIDRTRHELSEVTLRHPENEHNVLMGMVMNRIRGKVNGRSLSENILGNGAEERR
ncbi:MAG: Glu-tRNA(Gln) amidotransferase subunit GatE [Ignavibacteriales bacterium]|nr:Glu-tRNA(Gln) amidotransferase subunit GatE [Ignavibacteriales bacterium]